MVARKARRRYKSLEKSLATCTDIGLHYHKIQGGLPDLVGAVRADLYRSTRGRLEGREGERLVETLEDGQIPAISNIPVLVRVQATLQQEVGADQAGESPGENLARQSQVLELSNTLDSTEEQEEIQRNTMVTTAAEVDNLTDVVELRRLLKEKLQVEAERGEEKDEVLLKKVPPVMEKCEE